MKDVFNGKNGSLDNQGSNCSQKLGVNEFIIGEVLVQLSFDFVLFLVATALMKVLFWLLHPDPRSRATIKDLQKDKWTNQPVDETQLNFDAVLG